MKKCTFELNGQAMSSLTIGALSFPAFSGLGDNINRRISACIPDLGPIPPGDYFILNRESGGGFYPALTDTSQPDEVSSSIFLPACPTLRSPGFSCPCPRTADHKHTEHQRPDQQSAGE